MGILDRLKSLLGRRSATESRSTALVQTRGAVPQPSFFGDVNLSLVDPAWASGDQSYLTPIALSSLWTYACSSLCAASVASVPLLVEVDGTVDQHHELASLLANPTPDHGFREWQEMRAYNLLLSGADYIELYFRAGETAQDDYAQPLQMWPYAEGIYSTCTQRVTSGRPLITHFERLTTRMPVERVIRSRLVNPGSFKSGLAPAIAALIEAQADREASTWQRESYKNRMVPDALFIVEADGWDEVRRAEKYVQSAWQGALNAHKPVVLGGGTRPDPLDGIKGSSSMTYQQLTQSALEADFVNSRELNRRYICSAFGVPEVLFGASDSTFANLAEARLWFWETTVKELVETLVDSLNAKLTKRYPGNVRIIPDYSRVPAMLDALEQRLDLAKKMTDLGVPMKQVNNRLELGLDEWSGWDKPHVGPAGARFVLQDVALERAEQQATIALTEAQTAALELPEETVTEVDDLNAEADNVISILRGEG